MTDAWLGEREVKGRGHRPVKQLLQQSFLFSLKKPK